MNATIGDRPKRLVARAMTRFLVASAQAWARPHGGDLTRTFVFCTVLSANLELLGPDDPDGVLAAGGEDDDRAAKRPISVHAVATSMSLPYETVRRKALLLEEDGMIMRSRPGLIVPAAALRDATMRAAMAEVRALLDEVLAILAAVGLDLGAFTGAPASSPAPAAPGDPVIARIVMAAQVRMLERVAPMFGDVVRAYVFMGVMRANVDDLLVDPDKAWRYATEEALPPDEVRTPVTVAELSRQLGIPPETVRRQVRQMTALGALVVTKAGVLAPTHVVSGGDAAYQNAKLSLEFFRMLAALGQAGLFATARA